jgi:hypothetical protein
MGDVRPLAPAPTDTGQPYLLSPQSHRGAQLAITTEGFGVDLVAPTVQQLRELGA